MSDKIKSMHIKTYFFITLFVILCGSFLFWYKQKNNSIKKDECSKVTRQKINNTKFYSFNEEAEKARDYNNYYQQCLHEKGL